MHLSCSRFASGFALFAATLGAFTGCSSEEGASPSEVVLPAREAVGTAIVRDGDAIYVAGPLSLDRVDAKSGVVTAVAGPEWATCPRTPAHWWSSMPGDFAYPGLVIRGHTAFLVQEDCGLWSFDLETKASRLLVDNSVDARVAVYNEEPIGSAWNGKKGPYWNSAFGMALALDGDALVGCMPVEALVPDPEGGGEDNLAYRRRIELRLIADDGTPGELLASLEAERDDDLAEYSCTQVIVLDDAYIVGTDRAILRWDRKTRALTPLVTNLSLGSRGLAADATDIYLVDDDNAIVKVPTVGGSVTTVYASTHAPSEAVRRVAGTDGDFLYLNDGYTLKRMRKDGGLAIDIARGDANEWVLPGSVGFGSEHVYFEKITGRRGEGREGYVGTLLRAAK